VALERLADLPTEVAFDLEHQSADFVFGDVRAIRHELLDEGLHAGRGLPRANRAEHGDPRVQAALCNCQPARVGRRPDFGGVMLLANHEK
jgi:hypothetical protein